jgi:hypothetical protein
MFSFEIYFDILNPRLSPPCNNIRMDDIIKLPYYYQKDHKYLLHDFQSDYQIIFSKCDELNDINEY